MNWISVKDRLPEEGEPYPLGKINVLMWQSDKYSSSDGNTYSGTSPILGGFADNRFYEVVHGIDEEVEGVTHWCEVTGPEEK